MRRIALMSLLFATCCGPQRPPQPGCISLCGLRLVGAGDCEALQDAETRAVVAFLPHLGDVCASFEGWTVERIDAPDGYWVDAWGRTVGGLTYCDSRLVQVVNRGDEWRHTALAHELLHVADCPTTDTAHTDWMVWRYRAIEQANR